MKGWKGKVAILVSSTWLAKNPSVKSDEFSAGDENFNRQIFFTEEINDRRIFLFGEFYPQKTFFVNFENCNCFAWNTSKERLLIVRYHQGNYDGVD